MGEARRRGTPEQRQAIALQQQRELERAEEQREAAKKNAEFLAGRDLYLKEVEELGEEEADRRVELRKANRHERHIRTASFLGMLSGMLHKKRPDKPYPTSLEDFENL